jgi:hypothetical protein
MSQYTQKLRSIAIPSPRPTLVVSLVPLQFSNLIITKIVTFVQVKQLCSRLY